MTGWSFWIELRGPPRLWAASITFTILGALIAFALPQLFFASEQDVIGSFAIQAFGWTCLILGLAVLLPMLATLIVRIRQPGKEAVWHWWINFIGGLLGALAFAVPATLMLPIFLIAYLMRPNALFPNDASAANNLWLAALFSVLGIITLIATTWLARLKMREEPKRGV